MRGDVCAQCGEDIHGVPTAFPLMLMKYDARLRFCNERCTEAYEVDKSDGDDSSTKETGRPR